MILTLLILRLFAHSKVSRIVEGLRVELLSFSDMSCLQFSLEVVVYLRPGYHAYHLKIRACVSIRKIYVSLSNNLILPQGYCDSTACFLILASACLIVYSARILQYCSTTYHHSPRYAFALDSGDRHYAVYVSKHPHKSSLTCSIQTVQTMRQVQDSTSMVYAYTFTYILQPGYP